MFFLWQATKVKLSSQSHLHQLNLKPAHISWWLSWFPAMRPVSNAYKGRAVLSCFCLPDPPAAPHFILSLIQLGSFLLEMTSDLFYYSSLSFTHRRAQTCHFPLSAFHICIRNRMGLSQLCYATKHNFDQNDKPDKCSKRELCFVASPVT